MSEFFRMPREWHDSLDASLPPIYPIEFMSGTKSDRITRRLGHVLETVKSIRKGAFCKAEGISIVDLNGALDKKSFSLKVWEDDRSIGAVE